MSDIIIAIILGIVEGLTEFLPVSSTGHLILVNQWLSFSKEFTVVFDIFIQLGAILAVIIHFRKDIFPKDTESLFEKEYVTFWLKILTAFLPALIIGIFLAEIIESHFFNPITVSISLLAGGILLLIFDHKNRVSAISSIREMPYRMAIYIGLFQCLAMIPGTSRSASTIIGALILGCSRKLATEFSFYLAIPTILGASIYSIFKGQIAFSPDDIILLFTGFAISFFIALAVIKFLLSFIQKHTFRVFGYYRIMLAALMLCWFFFIK